MFNKKKPEKQSMPKCDSFCGANVGKSSNSERRVVMGEWRRRGATMILLLGR